MMGMKQLFAIEQCLLYSLLLHFDWMERIE